MQSLEYACAATGERIGFEGPLYGETLAGLRGRVWDYSIGARGLTGITRGAREETVAVKIHDSTATLDLLHAPEVFRQAYADKRPRKNLFRYFVETRLANIRAPNRRFFTTNDPVLTPAMMDHFFNQRTQVFATLSDRQRLLLRSIYDRAEYRAVMPTPSQGADEVIELSLHGFQAECALPLPEGTRGWVEIDLGENETALAEATAVRRHEAGGQVFYGFAVPVPDAAWQRCVVALQTGSTHFDLDAVLPSPAPRPSASVARTQELVTEPD